jgi:hypothetical protein
MADAEVAVMQQLLLLQVLLMGNFFLVNSKLAATYSLLQQKVALAAELTGLLHSSPLPAAAAVRSSLRR